MTKDIIILTKSKKDNGYCVAGIEQETGKWIRLVSSNQMLKGALSDFDMQLTNGEICEPLDLVRVEIQEAVPKGCQTENHLIMYGKKWLKLGTKTINDVLKVHSPSNRDKIFGSSFPCLNAVDYFTYSLVLAEVENLRIYYNSTGSRKAEFIYNTIHYKGVSVTDIEYCRKRIHQNEFNYENAYIVVSIPNEPYEADGKYYKFIAKVFPGKELYTNRYDENDDLPF